MSFVISYRTAAAALLLWSAQAGAADARQNCTELAKVIPGLDQVAAGLGQNKVIEKGGELDKTLKALTASLEGIAKAEQNDDFSKAVTALGKAWEAADHPGFQRALEQVVGNVDRIRRRDCD